MPSTTTGRSVLGAFATILVVRILLWTYEAFGDAIPTGIDVKSGAQSAVLLVVDGLLLATTVYFWRRGGIARPAFAAMLILAALPIVLETMWLHDGISMFPGDEDFALGALPLSVEVLLLQVLAAWEFGLLVVVSQVVIVVIDTLIVTDTVSADSVVAAQTFEEIVLTTISTVIICWVVVMLAESVRSRTRDLAAANEALVDYAGRIEAVAAREERHRLAREMHDTLAHTLSSLTIQLGAIDAQWDLDPVESRRRLTQAEDSARHGLVEARRAMQALTASPVEELGLEQAIRDDVATTVPSSCAASVNWSLRSAVDPRLAPEVFRIVQEATRNSANHSGATTLGVEVGQRGDDLIVVIEDNGRGFDPTAASADDRPGHGVRAMRERAESVGGSLRVTSAPTGTRVELVAPLWSAQ